MLEEIRVAVGAARRGRRGRTEEEDAHVAFVTPVCLEVMMRLLLMLSSSSSSSSGGCRHIGGSGGGRGHGGGGAAGYLTC